MSREFDRNVLLCHSQFSQTPHFLPSASCGQAAQTLTTIKMSTTPLTGDATVLPPRQSVCVMKHRDIKQRLTREYGVTESMDRTQTACLRQTGTTPTRVQGDWHSTHFSGIHHSWYHACHVIFFPLFTWGLCVICP